LKQRGTKVFLSIFFEDILKVKCTASEIIYRLGNLGVVVQSSPFNAIYM